MSMLLLDIATFLLPVRITRVVALDHQMEE
jgi:hypothetical protein